MAEYPAAASALRVQPQVAQAQAVTGAEDDRTPASVQSGRRLNWQDIVNRSRSPWRTRCARRVKRAVGRLRKWARDADEGLLQAKRGGPRGCWTRTGPTLRCSGSERRRIGSAAVTGIGRTRPVSMAGPAAGALPNAQCSVCDGFPGCLPVFSGAGGAGNSGRQIVRENGVPLAGMKPAGISAWNTTATSRMLVTSSRLRRLKRVERISLSNAAAFSAGVYLFRHAPASRGHPTARYCITRLLRTTRARHDRLEKSAPASPPLCQSIG